MTFEFDKKYVVFVYDEHYHPDSFPRVSYTLFLRDFFVRAKGELIVSFSESLSEDSVFYNFESERIRIFEIK